MPLVLIRDTKNITLFNCITEDIIWLIPNIRIYSTIGCKMCLDYKHKGNVLLTTITIENDDTLVVNYEIN
jgi:hypothetical protein